MYRLAIVALMLANSVSNVSAQTTRSSAGEPSLKQYFERLAAADSASIPNANEFFQTVHTLSSSPAQDVAAAVPAMISALSNSEPEIVGLGSAALVQVLTRRDGQQFVLPHIKAVAALLQHPDSRAQGMGVLLLGMFMPCGAEVLDPLLAYAARTDVSAKNQSGAILDGLRCAPDNDRVRRAALEFQRRPLSDDDRVAFLNAIGTSKTKDPALLDGVIVSLEDSSGSVREAAAQTIRRLGRDAVSRAQIALENIVADEKEDERTRSNAEEALKLLEAPPRSRIPVPNSPN